MFDYAQNQIDRAVAAEAAGKLGARPHMDASHAAIFTFMGAFFGLEFLAVLTMDQLGKVVLLVVALAAGIAGIAFWSTRRREALWLEHFRSELEAIEKKRR